MRTEHSLGLFYVLLTVRPGMALGKWPTWCTITLYNTFIIIILYMFRATLLIIRRSYCINTASGIVFSVSMQLYCISVTDMFQTLTGDLQGGKNRNINSIIMCRSHCESLCGLCHRSPTWITTHHMYLQRTPFHRTVVQTAVFNLLYFMLVAILLFILEF